MKIGLVLIIAEHPVLERALSYTEIRRTALWAEEAGFDSLWLYDHLLYRSEGQGTIGIWECWSILSALADATQRVELGTLVCCNLFRNPAILAKMAVTVDEISSGRLILGLGAGWNTPEFVAFGIPHDRLSSRYDEAVQIIHPLLKEGKTDFDGQYYQAKDCVLAPRGPRPAGPPLMLAGFGPRNMRLVARYADAWNYGYLNGPAAFEEPLKKMRAVCREVGRDPDSLQMTGMVALGFPDLTDLSKFMEGEGYLSGTPAEIAEAMRGFESQGIAHLMFHVGPFTQPALDRLAEALELFRQAKVK